MYSEESLAKASLISTEGSGKKITHKEDLTDIAIQAAADESVLEEEHPPIRLIQIIFLPFSSWWQIIIICSVIIKCILGPLSAILPILHCSADAQNNFFLKTLRVQFSYIGEVLYIIDTFLYIVHRQVTDEAMKREYLPKPTFLLLLDVLSLLPLFDLCGGELCNPTPTLWPHIMCFNHLLVIYRVANYFSLKITHSYWNLVFGYIILFGLMINGLTCFFLLVTVTGMCKNCKTGLYDWRSLSVIQGDSEKRYLQFYLTATFFVTSNLFHRQFDENIKPSTYVEFLLVDILLIWGTLVLIFVLMPKLFAENLIRTLPIYNFQSRVMRVIQDTERRNPSPSAPLIVERFYSLVWSKENGFTSVPPVIKSLPKYLRLGIEMDLSWALFYHSPTFRNTSMPFKRWVCEYIKLDCKLPGERFFFGPHCYSNVYYIRSGIAHFISADDSSVPILSVKGGTVFGDISFFIPPFNRKVAIRCFTFCEIIYVSRETILKAIHYFPHDRHEIVKMTNERISHAKALFENKKLIRGTDRCEDEGIAWLKHRWYDIGDLIRQWKKTSGKRQCCKIPIEDNEYHCSKYIGQLVLCKDYELKRKTIFYKVTFPWVLDPNSVFNYVWIKILTVSVYIVLFVFPITIIRLQHTEPHWFMYLNFYINLVYLADIIILLLTAEIGQEYIETDIMTTIFNHSKNKFFILDLLSSPLMDLLANMFIPKGYTCLIKFNRLIKIYILFIDRQKTSWNVDYLNNTYYVIALSSFCSVYIPVYLFYLLVKIVPSLTPSYFFGDLCLDAKVNDITGKCDSNEVNAFGYLMIVLGYLAENILGSENTSTLPDLVLYSIIDLFYYVFKIFLKMKLISTLYLKYNDMNMYQNYVTKIKKHYTQLKIHPDLLKRLDRYLNVHWKFHKGMDVLKPITLQDEPYDVYFKLHGEVAEEVIRESQAFKNADNLLIKELASYSKFLIIPRGSIVYAFGIQVENVTWIVRGAVKCEYQDDEGNSQNVITPIGEILAMTTVFFGQTALRTYSAVSDCEILFLRLKDFAKVIEKYPVEWSYFQTCIKELGPQFDEMHSVYSKKYKEYQSNLRIRIFHERQSVISFKTEKKSTKKRSFRLKIPNFFKDFRHDPEAKCTFYWFGLRSASVAISIIAFGLYGGSGALIYGPLMSLVHICQIMGVIDIILKFFRPYYDDRGIVISDLRKCALNYLSRTFITDAFILLSAAQDILINIIGSENRRLQRAVITLCDSLALYVPICFLNYCADQPSTNAIFIVILKSQLLIVLAAFIMSFYYVWDCIWLDWDKNGRLIEMNKTAYSCWMPSYLDLDDYPTVNQLHMTFAQALSLVQSAYNNALTGEVSFEHNRIVHSIVFLLLSSFFWYQTCQLTAIIVLYFRGDTLTNSDINQLKNFLEEERIDRETIDRVLNYYSYMFKRAPPIDTSIMLNEQFSIVFRQDLYYYFYKKTLNALDTLLKGGKPVCRQLASACTVLYFLPGSEILREFQLSPNIFIVHRGKVKIFKDNKKIATLTKGAIFGQLQGTKLRPVHIGAQAKDHVDILCITVKEFQDIINDSIRRTLAKYPQVIDNYIGLKKSVAESPYNTVQYILRGMKTIKLPTMKSPVSAEDNDWYARWLLVSWVIGPMLSAALVLILVNLPPEAQRPVIWVVLVLDVEFLLYFISEFFTMELKVVDVTCVYKYKGWKKFTELWLYLDAISLLLPLVMMIMKEYTYYLLRLPRLYTIYSYHRHFKGYKSRKGSVLLKIAMVLLLIHGLACMWMGISCKLKKYNSEFPVKFTIPPIMKMYIDSEEWVLPDKRRDGCPRVVSLDNRITNSNSTDYEYGFVVPNHWYADYLVALSYICILHARFDVNPVLPLTVKEVYFTIFARYVLYIVELWVCGYAISSIYTWFHQMYTYDYKVDELVKYLSQNGVSPILLQNVKAYTRILWQKYKGSQLPEITKQAPLCLKEDILGALYMHHLQTPTLFQSLPQYFLRQMSVRLQRKVVFPGINIVLEGDIHSCIYFIHEGEVERIYTDHNGESRVASVLSTNGYFGLIPGLFPEIPYQYSYCSRTFVDAIYLMHSSWQDLLDGYPDIKEQLYTKAQKIKRSKTAEKKI